MAELTAVQRLAEAKTALHRLLTGQSVVRIQDSNNESVTYNQGNVSRLRVYIAELEAEIAGAVTPQMRGPIRPRFV